MKRMTFFGCSLLMATLLVNPAMARPVAVVQDDGTRYTEFFSEQDAARKAAMGEKFLEEFKNSTYVDAVYRTIVPIYYKANNWAKVMELADKLETLDPEAEAKNKAQIYALAMDAARRTNNIQQIIGFGEKVLAIAPDDVITLYTLATTIPNAMPNDKAAIQKAETYANKGIAALEKADAQSLGMNETDKVSIQGALHNTLGGIFFNRQDYEKAVEQLTTATKLTPMDGSSWYLLGFSYSQQAIDMGKKTQEAVSQYNDGVRTHADRVLLDELKATQGALEEAYYDKRDQAMDALATAVNCGGTTKDAAMTQLTKLWTAKNNGSTAGLNDFIKSKKPGQ
jgi:tetratricopeptide (TPR) repeat protein